MTTGSYTRDLRTGPGYALEGHYYTRTWSGSDYPKTRPLYTNVFVRSVKPLYVNRRLVRDGFNVYRTSWAKKPKRSRNEEHNYSTFGKDSVITATKWSSTSASGPFDRLDSYPDVTNLPLDISQWSDNDTLALIGKLREEIAGSDFNPAIFLAEGHQALNMVFDSASRIAKAMRFAKKGNFVSAARSLTHGYHRRPIKVPRDAARNWLELQYGWLPLLQDAEAGARYLAHQFSKPARYVVTARRFAQGRQAFHGKLENFNLPLGVRYVVQNSQQIRAILSEVNVVSLSGLTDPLSVAWELLPYSFVADWFIPIGSFLSARGLAQSLTGTFVTTSRVTQTFSGPVYGIRSASSSGWVKKGGNVSLKYYSFSRSVSNSLQVPTPSIKPLNRVLSWKHATNSVALLVNAHGSRA